MNSWILNFFFTYHTWIGKSVYMDDLYVKDKYRKKGIGKRLLDSIIEIGKQEKCEKLRWQVSDWNKNAQEFYKSLGAQIDNHEYNCDLYLKNLIKKTSLLSFSLSLSLWKL